MAADPPKPASDLIERLLEEEVLQGKDAPSAVAIPYNRDGPEAAARLKEYEAEVERLREAYETAAVNFRALMKRAEAAEDLSERRRVGLDDAIAEVAKWSQACRAAEARAEAAEAKLASLSPKE